MVRKIALLIIVLVTPAFIYSGHLKAEKYVINLHEKDEEQLFSINRFRFVHMVYRVYDTFGLGGFIPSEDFGSVVKNLYEDLRRNYQKQMIVKQYENGKDLKILFKFLRFKEQKDFGFYVVTNYDLKAKGIAIDPSTCEDCHTLWYLYGGDLLTDHNKKIEPSKATAAQIKAETFDDLNALATKFIFDDSKANDIQIKNLLDAGLKKAKNEKEMIILFTTYIEYLLYRDDLSGAEKQRQLFDEAANKINDAKGKKLVGYLKKYIGLLIQGYKEIS